MQKTLLEKVEASLFPSTEMIKRLDGLAARLEELELRQHQQRQ
jgi:hypothetical protein